MSFCITLEVCYVAFMCDIFQLIVYVDSMTSPKGSTAPYSIIELRNILGLANDMDRELC